MTAEPERVEWVPGQQPLPGMDERPDQDDAASWDWDDDEDGVCYGDEELVPCDCCEEEAAIADGLCDECLDHGLGVHATPAVVTLQPLGRYL